MADVVITMRIMPSSVDVDLESLTTAAKNKIEAFAGMNNMKTEIKPVAFGLKAIEIMFVSPEANGSTETLEAEIAAMEGAESVEVTDVRRSIG
ncbi:MAG: elongation factor 1-beta [Nanoarchaeota archaeon]|nr:elongation factor 1-beta [Nanoarchaeota archaeon]